MIETCCLKSHSLQGHTTRLSSHSTSKKENNKKKNEEKLSLYIYDLKIIGKFTTSCQT